VPIRPQHESRTAFILSGGGARGALQVGALRALLEHGISPDLVVGTSVGAWNGVALARTPTLDAVRHLTTLWQEATASRILLGRRRGLGSSLMLHSMLAWDGLRRVRRGHSSLCPDTGLREVLGVHLGNVTFADLSLPMHIMATDLGDGERTVFTSGKMMPALLASCAIPGIFPPVRIGDRIYADGGALGRSSFTAALEGGARRLFVLVVGPETPEGANGSASGYRAVQGLSAADVVERSMVLRQIAELRQVLRLVPVGVQTHVIALSPGKGGFFDFERAPEWIDRGYALTRAYLASAPLAHEERPAEDDRWECTAAAGSRARPIPA
jgi:NTE family protein